MTCTFLLIATIFVQKLTAITELTMATLVQTAVGSPGPEAPEAIHGYFASKPNRWHHGNRHGGDRIVTADILANIGKDATPQDRQDMRRVGRVQVFRRNFRLLSSICFASCVMSTWEVLLTASGPGLIHGGLPGLFWSMCWSYLGQFFVVLSLAEMASMAPVSSGQYHCWYEFSSFRSLLIRKGCPSLLHRSIKSS